MGAKYLWFDQSLLDKRAGTALLAKGTFELSFPTNNWVLWGDVQGTLTTFQSKPTGNTFGFFNWNLRLGYVFTNASSPIQFALSAGITQQGLRVSPKGAGYNVFGLIIFPTISHDFGQNRISLYP